MEEKERIYEIASNLANQYFAVYREEYKERGITAEEFADRYLAILDSMLPKAKEFVRYQRSKPFQKMEHDLGEINNLNTDLSPKSMTSPFDGESVDYVGFSQDKMSGMQSPFDVGISENRDSGMHL